ncbi:MAG: hypothetical protein IIA83_02970 [Thaumarchaeota archaeon]|nr:hypothetical protein [Nitrososphaerota archaeon]
MTYVKKYQIDNTEKEDIDNALRKAGFQQASMNTPIPPSEISGILGSLGATVRNSLNAGRSRIVPRERSEFTNGSDRVTVNSFDIEENFSVRNDPVIFVYEEVYGRTSTIIEEILQDEVTKDVIKFALVSITSSNFRTSVKDLARIREEDPQTVYNRCIKTLIKSCVTGFKRIDVKEVELLPEQQKQKVFAEL